MNDTDRAIINELVYYGRLYNAALSAGLDHTVLSALDIFKPAIPGLSTSLACWLPNGDQQLHEIATSLVTRRCARITIQKATGYCSQNPLTRITTRWKYYIPWSDTCDALAEFALLLNTMVFSSHGAQTAFILIEGFMHKYMLKKDYNTIQLDFVRKIQNRNTQDAAMLLKDGYICR